MSLENTVKVEQEEEGERREEGQQRHSYTIYTLISFYWKQNTTRINKDIINVLLREFLSRVKVRVLRSRGTSAEHAARGWFELYVPFSR